MVVNKAAYLSERAAKPFQVRDAPMPSPGPHEVVLRNRAVAMNPCDWAIQEFGMIVEKYPAVIGEDAAGDIVAVGDKVTRFRIGDRVLALCDAHGKLSGYEGTFQHFLVTQESLVSAIPDSLSFAHAAVLPLGMSTAGGGLFEPGSLELAHPPADGKDAPANGKVVVIWGGSSSVGSCAIQAARAAGYEVAATAGARNIEYCRSLGARHVFDHSSETVVEEVVSALKGKESAGVFDAIIAGPTVVTCTKIAKALGGKQMVSTVLAPGFQTLPDDVAEGVEAPPNSGIVDEKVKHAIWGQWVPAALKTGALQCKPDAKVVGQGLESIQEAIDLMGKGVSALKLVVEL